MNRGALLTTPLRLWAAAVLALVPLGRAWSNGFASIGHPIYGDYRPGGLGSGAPVRVFLVLAAAAFVFTAVRRRTARTRRIARLGTVALAIATALAAAAGVRAIVLCCLLGLVLTVPLVWHRPVLAHSPPPG